jgi:hypothetical protein
VIVAGIDLPFPGTEGEAVIVFREVPEPSEDDVKDDPIEMNVNTSLSEEIHKMAEELLRRPRTLGFTANLCGYGYVVEIGLRRFDVALFWPKNYRETDQLVWSLGHGWRLER